MAAAHDTYLGEPPAHWVGALGGEDPLLRRLACYALGEIGPAAGPEAAAALAGALEDPAHFVRVWAAAALARVDPAHPGAVPALVAALHDEAGFVRSLGAWHLGRIGPGAAGIAAAIPALTALLDDANRSAATEAAVALKGLQHPGVRQRG